MQVREGPPDPPGRQQGLRLLLLHSLGAAVPDEFQRGLLHSCPGQQPGAGRSAALRLLAGTSGPGGTTGRPERLTGSAHADACGPAARTEQDAS